MSERAATRLFTSESVTRGHPDKVADQISDAILDALIAVDPHVRVACETLVTTGLVILAGEITAHNPAAEKVLLEIEDTVRGVIRRIGYVDPALGFDYRSCAILRTLHSQSADIAIGVDADKDKTQGAGDQGLMFGFACDETKALMPLPIQLAHRLTAALTDARESGAIPWLRPDGKSQVTVEYRDEKPLRLHTVVLSTQHDESALEPASASVPEAARRVSKAARQELIAKIIRPVVSAERKELWNDRVIFHINPTGRFIVGGPCGDTGLTGRKIIVDTYGGRGSHGGGAFSGKDPSKVDRSASYMARHVAKNIVAAGLARACEIQLAYAIGVAEPVSVLVDCEGTGSVQPQRLASAVRDVFPLTPAEIIRDLDLLRPIYLDTAHDGHFGRDGEHFTWERTDHVDQLRKACGL
jgi:S-adenosylmethionine synthetase